MSNPYQSSQFADYPSGPSTFGPPPADPGLFGHVRIVAILMMVQGILALGMGTLYLIYVLSLSETQLQRMNQQPGGPPKEVMIATYYIVGGVMSGGGFVSGLCQILGGLFAFNYRSRGLVIASLIGTLCGVATCYCAPTSITLVIYGLIVLFSEAVYRAFALKAQGWSNDQIHAAIYGNYLGPG